MFERFTEKARGIFALAQKEARYLSHNKLSPEHFLLGIIREEGGVASEVLRNLGVDLEGLKLEIEKRSPHGNRSALNIIGNVPFTPSLKKVLKLAVEETEVEETENMGHNYISTEHLLLGLIK
jgi:ATP-dependent Clp protease ATP-binding subunit ClpC